MAKLRVNRTTWFRWLLPAIACGAIFTATASPAFTAEHTMTIVHKWTGLSIDNAYHINAVLRKVFHFLFFGSLAVLFYISIRSRKIRYAWLCASIGGALDEVHQIFVPGRTPSAADVLLDSLAALLFLVIFALLRY